MNYLPMADLFTGSATTESIDTSPKNTDYSSTPSGPAKDLPGSTTLDVAVKPGQETSSAGPESPRAKLDNVELETKTRGELEVPEGKVSDLEPETSVATLEKPDLVEDTGYFS